jgi:hypothetical protein
MKDGLLIASHVGEGQIEVVASEYFIAGKYTLSTMGHELEKHMLEFHEPKTVKVFSGLTRENAKHFSLQVLHPCFPPGREEELDSSVPTLRKGIVEGEVGFLNLFRNPVLKCEHSMRGEKWTEIDLIPLSSDPRLVEGACLAALVLVYFHPLQDPTAPYQY